MLLGARVLLAGVFALAGLAKVADLAGSRRAVRDFGVPGALAPATGTLLPAAELAVAIALIARASARWGAVGALLLLAAFVAAIGVAMLRGREPECHCFGQLHSAPAGWGTLLRTAALAGVAAFVVVVGWNDAGLSATGWLARLSAGALAAVGVGVLVVVSQVWFSWQLLRQQGRLLLRIEQLESHQPVPAASGRPVGSIAPDFSLPTPSGAVRSLAHLGAAGKSLLLLFSDPACGPCRDLLPKASRLCAQQADALRSVLISRRGNGGGSERELESYGLELLVDDENAVQELYEVHGTPGAVLVDREGRIAAPTALGAEAIFQLIDYVAYSLPSPSDSDHDSPSADIHRVPSRAMAHAVSGERSVALRGVADRDGETS